MKSIVQLMEKYTFHALIILVAISGIYYYMYREMRREKNQIQHEEAEVEKRKSDLERREVRLIKREAEVETKVQMLKSRVSNLESERDAALEEVYRLRHALERSDLKESFHQKMAEYQSDPFLCGANLNERKESRLSRLSALELIAKSSNLQNEHSNFFEEEAFRINSTYMHCVSNRPINVLETKDSGFND